MTPEIPDPLEQAYRRLHKAYQGLESAQDPRVKKARRSGWLEQLMATFATIDACNARERIKPTEFSDN